MPTTYQDPAQDAKPDIGPDIRPNTAQDTVHGTSLQTPMEGGGNGEGDKAKPKSVGAFAQAGMRLTPMFEQYLSIKSEHPDSLLFYRMGDFYEMFFEDAEIAAKELQIALTCRNSNAEHKIPMCGVPHHSADLYLAELLNKGYRVAICEQIEDPKAAKGLVKRAVTRILTPGTVIENINQEPKGSNFLGALYWSAPASGSSSSQGSSQASGRGAFAWLDCSTGQWTGLSSKKETDLWQWVLKMAPTELVLPDVQYDELKIPEDIKQAKNQILLVPVRAFFNHKLATEKLLKAQGVAELGALGLEDKPELTMSCGALLTYLGQTRKDEQVPIQPFKPLAQNRYLVLDEVTERNLELFRRMDGSKGAGTLLHVLDHCHTPMGSRLLQERLHYPFREIGQINEIQEAVACLVRRDKLRLDLRAVLGDIQDLERLSTRIHVNRATPRDVLALGGSLQKLAELRKVLETPERKADNYPNPDEADGADLPKILQVLLKKWDDLDDVSGLLCRAMADSPPLQVTEGGIFRQGFNSELDEFIDLAEHGEQRLNELLAEEQQATGIAKLKLSQNRVFGYYFEVPRSLADKLPERFTRRQTVANAERLITPKLKELEEKLLSATERRNKLEYSLFQGLRQNITNAWPRIIFMAGAVAALDYWQSLAETAARNKWCRPVLHTGLDMEIKEGRHPVVEAMQGRANFIPNDLYMDGNKRLLIITGPNMAGKSTVLRQTAIITILAQMGSFVPATEARIGLTDRIFCRVGASDNLAEGQSTFMTEMMESARILRQAGRSSLIILDEVGRGTSTFDGLSLAWAIAEDLCVRADANLRTLFATHYHELTTLEGKMPGVANMNIAIKEWGGDIIFLRRLVPGPSDRSYGIEVARLAGVPQSVVQRARVILGELEQSRNSGLQKNAVRESRQLLPGITKPADNPDAKSNQALSVIDAIAESSGTAMGQAQPPAQSLAQAEPHPMLLALQELDCNHLSPMQAFNTLMQWKELWDKKQ